MKDGEPDFSKYTAEQIARSLSRVDREKYPLNHANLLAAQRALPPPPDEAALETVRIARLRQEILDGQVWLSAAWTWAFSTALPAACTFTLIWLARKLFFNPAINTSVVDVREWSALEPFLYAVAGVVFLLVGAWFPMRMRRLVMHHGVLEVRGHIVSETVDLRNIERVRWNDRPMQYESRAAVIELRVAGRFGRKLLFFPRSVPVMRAFAAHVAAVSGSADVADPAFISIHQVGAADP